MYLELYLNWGSAVITRYSKLLLYSTGQSQLASASLNI